MENNGIRRNAVYQHMVRHWHVRPIKFGRRASYGGGGETDAELRLDNVSWADSSFYSGSRRAGDALVLSLRRRIFRPAFTV